MADSQAIQLVYQALWLVLLLSAPPVLVAALVGTLVSLLQALTQIQEQTLGFVAKLIAVVITLFATTAWLGNELYSFADMVLFKVPQIQ